MEREFIANERREASAAEVSHLFAGKKAERNPWQANTLEWSAPTPPPHGNFEVQPVVYRGPYEYSSPEVKEDWLPQDKNLGAGAVARGH